MTRSAGYLGLGLLAAVWLFPLASLAGPFPGHMLRHASLVAVIAPLLVLGWPRVARRLTLPALPAAVLEGVIVWSWHLPALHGLARANPLANASEQASFLGAGVLVWASAMARGQALAGAGALLLTSMHMTLLGALLVLAPRALYHDSADLAGQQLGGIVMLAIVTPAYLLAGLALVFTSLNSRGAA